MSENKNNIIPKGWKYLPFGDVFEFIQSNALSREQLTFDEHEGEIFNIHYGDIHATYKTDILDLDKEDKVPRIKDIIESKSLAFLKEGDLVIADASEDYKGVAANLEIKNIKSRKVTGGLHTFVARDNSGLTVQGFRTYILKNPAITTDLKKLATGSKVFGVSKTNLATLKVLIPPEKEQIKIAQMLSKWENAIETLEHYIAKKERVKKALMQQLLTGKKRIKEYKNNKWTFSSLVNLTEKIGDGLHGTPKYIDSSTYYFINGNNLIGGKIFVSESTKCISKEEFESGKKALNSNTILISINGTIGNIAVYNGEEVMLGKSVAYIICNENLNKHFLFHYLSSEIVKAYIENELTGSTIRNLSLKSIRDIPIPSIPISEQIKIANVLSKCDLEIESLREQMSHYKLQKQGLMQQLLTGKIRVKI